VCFVLLVEVFFSQKAACICKLLSDGGDAIRLFSTSHYIFTFVSTTEEDRVEKKKCSFYKQR
jgi:hypothetical protein